MARLMKFLFLCFPIMALLVYAEPVAPGAEEVAEWVAFNKPVHLEAEKIEGGDIVEWGEPIWVRGYSAKKEALCVYVISLYKAGSLFGKNRAEMEKRIGEQIEKLKELREKSPNSSSRELLDAIRIETRPDGRKVYFTVLGFGPGGAAMGGFTTVGKYDLLVQQLEDFEDDMPAEKRLKDPAMPTAKLGEIFAKVERFIGEGR